MTATMTGVDGPPARTGDGVGVCAGVRVGVGSVNIVTALHLGEDGDRDYTTDPGGPHRA